jgi:hypothetical protein
MDSEPTPFGSLDIGDPVDWRDTGVGHCLGAKDDSEGQRWTWRPFRGICVCGRMFLG